MQPEPSTAVAVGDPPWLTVAAAARMLGVAPATLRTWDRRYGIGPSGHAPGRHRRYSADDVARLDLMQHALVRGASPAEAARFAMAATLPHPDAGEPNRSALVPAPAPAAVGSGRAALAGADGIEESRSRVRVGGRVLRLPGAGRRARGLGRAALALDAAAATALLTESISADGVRVAWDEVARPVLSAVADRWADTGAGVEIEHLLSECVMGAFGAHAAAAPSAVTTRAVLLAAMPGELHTLPLVALAAELLGRGVACRSLGADLPGDALVAAVRRTAPVAVVLWSQLPATADPELLSALPRTRPRGRTYVAGPGWAEVELAARIVRLNSLSDATAVLTAAASA